MVVVGLCYLLVLVHVRGRAGRAWAMIRRSEVCALAGGVNIVAYKVWAFALAGFLAGIAGGLLAGGVGQLDGSAFPASQSIMLFALTIVGGAYSWIGPFIAGLLFRAFPALLNDFRVDGNIATIVFGVGLLHALDHRAARRGRPAPGHRRGSAAAALPANGRTMIEIDDLSVQFGGVRGLNALTASLAEPLPAWSDRTARARRR